jgi:hypothetical protein
MDLDLADFDKMDLGISFDGTDLSLREPLGNDEEIAAKSAEIAAKKEEARCHIEKGTAMLLEAGRQERAMSIKVLIKEITQWNSRRNANQEANVGVKKDIAALKKEIHGKKIILKIVGLIDPLALQLDEEPSVSSH